MSTTLLRSQFSGKEKLECLSDRKLQQIKRTFQHFAYGDGTISDSKLKQVGRKIGMLLTDQDVKEMQEAIDLDGNGKVEFIEFKKEMERLQAHGNDNWNLFLSIDTNHDSFLSADEWKNNLEKVGEDSRNVTVVKWMATADTTPRDGKVSCPEFLDLYKGQ